MFGSLILLFLTQQVLTVPQDSGIVEGVVTTSTGRQAAGVRVTAMIPPSTSDDNVTSNTAMASIAQTDSEGRYRLERIPAGKYYIAAGRVDVPTYYPGTIQLLKGNLIAVASGATIPNVSFVLDDVSAGRAANGGGARGGAPNQPPPVEGPVGLTVPVIVKVENGGKIPVFGSRYYPVLRLTRVPANRVTEVPLRTASVILPVPPGPIVEEYTVAVDKLPDGYAVKTITHASTDVQKETLKFYRRELAIQPSTSGIGEIARTSDLVVTLTYTPTPAMPGVRITGRSIGMGDEIYLSGQPGLLYSDGTFEFQGVSPGAHTILRVFGSVMMASPVFVRDQNIDTGINLEVTPLLPMDLFSGEPRTMAGNEPASLPLATVVGRVVDETSQQPLTQGQVTLTGHRNAQRSFAIDATGGFRVPALLPGQYELTINARGYRATTHAVSVGFKDLSLDLKATR